MDVAWHMVKKHGYGGLAREINAFASMYPELMAGEDGLGSLLSHPHRIYVGDEFCPIRLPSPHVFAGFLAFAKEKGLPLTLLTPVLTDQGIEASKVLFDQLKQWNPKAEVVVNDLGVLFYLKNAYPEFRLSLGRLFNKGFKDPRLNAEDISMAGDSTAFLNHCSFKQGNVQALAKTLGIQRLEQDLFPHADPGDLGDGSLSSSVYFPFGYVTTGRACFMAGMGNTPQARFQFNNGCTSPCATHALGLKNPQGNHQLIQNGNTIFYRYTLSMMKGVIKKARSHGLRLVYQGGLA